MGIVLEKMSESAYSKFYHISLENQVDELMRKEHLSRENAELETQKELREMLPEGLDTADNYLFSILHHDCVVGYIWFLTECFENRKQAFLCDFMIFENFRRIGFGKAVLAAMEKTAADLQCKDCVLFVEEDNTIAQKLYAEAGYEIVRKHNYGSFMKKELI